MSDIILNQVSDKEIAKEYKKRFFLKSGDKLSGSQDAASIIVGHNHPSGATNPSRDDIQITNKIYDACKTVDIVLHDHIIIAGNNGFYSFSDEGVL